MEHESERGTKDRQEATHAIDPADAVPDDVDPKSGTGPGGDVEHAIEDRPREQARDEPDEDGFSAGAV